MRLASISASWLTLMMDTEDEDDLFLMLDNALPPHHPYIWTDLWTNAAGVYFMALIVFGVTFPLIYYAREPDYNANAVATFFYTYLYLGSSIMLAYMHVALRRYRKMQERRFVKSLKGHMTYKGLSVESFSVLCTALGRTADHFPNINIGQGNSIVPPFEESEEGVHILLRVGAIVFTLAAFIEDGLQLAGYVDPQSTSLSCYGAGSIVIIAARILFIFSITFFIFKYHKVVIQKQVAVMKFCLSHLVASALVLWSTTVIKEALEIYMESLSRHHETPTDMTTTVTRITDISTTTITNDLAATGSHPGQRTYQCLNQETVGASAAPYLYPFVIELSLVVAAVLHHIFQNTRHHQDNTGASCIVHHDNSVYLEITRGYECHKSTCGLFLGLCVFAANCVFVAIYVMEVETTVRNYDNLVQFTVKIYFGCHSALNILGIIAVLMAFYQMRHLGMSPSHDKLLDQNLLIISLGGYYFLLAFEAIAAFDSIAGNMSKKASLHLGASLLGYVQSTLQVIFTMIALRMRASSPVHVVCKPGRTTIAFLVLINFAMWVTNTFQMKALGESVILNYFYGELAWVLIFNVFLPLSIFFRFHSSICLVEVWTVAYRMTEEVKESQSFPETAHNNSVTSHLEDDIEASTSIVTVDIPEAVNTTYL